MKENGFDFPQEKPVTESAPEVDVFALFNNIEKESESVTILPENRNKDGKLLAPNGKESKLQDELYWKIIRTPNFLKWFGDWQSQSENTSKVVDKVTQEPMVVYHATIKDIGVEGLQPRELNGVKKAPWADKTIFFTSQPEVAKYFADQKKGYDKTLRVSFFSCFLNIKKPVVVKSHNDLG